MTCDLFCAQQIRKPWTADSEHRPLHESQARISPAAE